MPPMLVNNPSEKHTVWVRPHLYRPGLEIGLVKHVAAHEISDPVDDARRVWVPEKFFDAAIVWNEAGPMSIQQGEPKSLMVLAFDQAQQLMESLWNAGVRPAAAAGSIGQLAAVEKHLADMRALTAHVIQVKLPA